VSAWVRENNGTKVYRNKKLGMSNEYYRALGIVRLILVWIESGACGLPIIPLFLVFIQVISQLQKG
jgi:hypothetical protein